MPPTIRTRESSELDELIQAAQNNDANELEHLLKQPQYLCYVDNLDKYEKYSPLAWAAKQGAKDAVAVLCQYAKIDMQVGWNMATALIKATEKNHHQVIQVLVDHGANLNLKNQCGMTALMLAAELGHLECADILVKSGANVNLTNNDQYTALLLAATEGYDDIVKLLVNVPGIKLETGNKFGKTALFMAAENGHFDVLQTLYSHGADCDAMSKRGLTPLMLACVKGHKDVVHYLLDDRANLLLKTHSTALSMACSGGQKEIVDILIEKDRRVLNNAYLPLLTACQNGNLKILETLLSTNVVTEAMLRKQNQDGNTCLMLACEKGNIDIVIALMNTINNLKGKSPAPSILDIESSKIWTATNKQGNNVLSLLAAYYRDHEDKFGDFLKRSVQHNSDKPFLLEMLSLILPTCRSPLTHMKSFKDKMVNDLRNLDGHDADIQLVGALINIAAALRQSASEHFIESRDLLKMSDEFEDAIVECMNSSSMDSLENVTAVLRKSARRDDANPEVVVRATAILHGPLNVCLRNDLTKILATSQVVTFVNALFYGSLKEKQPVIIRSIPDIFLLRSGCSTYRYSPIVMFCLEGVYKVCFAILVMIVATANRDPHECTIVHFQRSYFGVSCLRLWMAEWLVTVMLIGSVFYEIGEIAIKVKRLYANDAYSTLVNLISCSRRHFKDRWNVLDFVVIALLVPWWFIRYYWNDRIGCKAWLATSAIPLSLGLLRFHSISRHTGQLVIMVFEMMNDLQAFVVIFLTCLMGFGISFHCLFAKLQGGQFANLPSTFLTLFDAALGSHDFSVFSEVPEYATVGVVLMIVFICIVMIVLLNLVIARMSATHEKIDSSAMEIWSKLQAINTEEFLLLYERSPMCQLPPPLNLITMAVSVVETWWNRKSASNQPKEHVLSLTGTISDKITSLALCPVAALIEVYLANVAIWHTTIPRWVQWILSFGSVVLFPTWYVFFFMLTLWSIYLEEYTFVHRTTQKIIFRRSSEAASSTSFVMPSQRVCIAVLAATMVAIWLVQVRWYCVILATGAIAVVLFIPDVPFKSGNLITCMLQSNWIPPQWSMSLLERYRFSSILCGVLTDDLLHRFNRGELELSILRSRHLFNHMKVGHRILSKRFNVNISEKEYFSGILFCCRCIAFGGIPAAILSLSSLIVYFFGIFLLLGGYDGIRELAWTVARSHFPSLFDSSTVRLSDQVSAALKLKRQARKYLQSLTEGSTESVAALHCGTLQVKLIRGSLGAEGISMFGRRANPYVVMTYRSVFSSKPFFSKTVLRGGSEPQWNETFKLQLEASSNVLQFDIYDQEVVSERPTAISPLDRRICWTRVDIREWIANRKYEGDLKLQLNGSGPSDAVIQIDARVQYDQAVDGYSPVRSSRSKTTTPRSPKDPTAEFLKSMESEIELSATVRRLRKKSSFNDEFAPPEREPLFARDDRKRIFDKLMTEKDDSDADDELFTRSEVMSLLRRAFDDTPLSPCKSESDCRLPSTVVVSELTEEENPSILNSPLMNRRKTKSTSAQG